MADGGEALGAAGGGLEGRQGRLVEGAAVGVPDVVGAGAEGAVGPGVDEVEAQRVVDADLRGGGISHTLGHDDTPGWREVLLGQTAQAVPVSEGLSLLPVGRDASLTEANTGIDAVRRAVAGWSAETDLVLICAESPGNCLTTELLLSVSDLGLAEVCPADRKAAIAAHIPRLDSLPRQGGAIIFSKAHRGDPGLAA